MTRLETATAFLVGEVEALEVFEFVVVAPVGEPLHVVEVTRSENGSLEVRVPGRPALVPPLEASVLSTLRERDFSSENPEDPTKPWVRAVADAEAAVDLLREVRVEVFGEKLDGSVDIAHGSHKAEHDARQKIAVARARIEPILKEILGQSAKQDEDKSKISGQEGCDPPKFKRLHCRQFRRQKHPRYKCDRKPDAVHRPEATRKPEQPF